MDGQKISTERMPFIGFDVAQKRIYGNSGCNHMMGSFEAAEIPVIRKLKFHPPTSFFRRLGSVGLIRYNIFYHIFFQGNSK